MRTEAVDKAVYEKMAAFSQRGADVEALGRLGELELVDTSKIDSMG